MVSLLREPARPAIIRDHRLAPWLAVGAVCFGAFMGQLDASVVTVAFPALQRQFGTSLAAVQWVSLAYLLTLTAVLVPAGRWSDRVGRKLVYLYGFVVFAAASAACGLAPSLGLLIVLRAVQAVGAAMLQANSVAIVVTSVPGDRRRAALGIQAAAQAVGLASGPLAGGLLVAVAGWRWVFFLNVPVGLIAVAAGWYLLPRTRDRVGRDGSDLPGTGLLAVTATAGMLAVSALSGLRWPDWAAAGCAAAAVLAGTCLWHRERRVRAPLLDFRMLAASGAGWALAGALCSYLLLFGPLVLFPQVVTFRGGSALQAGLLLTALPAAFGLAAACGDRVLGAQWTSRRRCVAGGALAAGAAAGLAAPLPDAAVAVLLGLLGAGLGLYTPANNAEIMTALPAREAATAGGMVNMTRGIGTALGVAAVALGLHAASFTGLPGAGTAVSMALLAAAGVVAVAAAARSRPAAAGDGAGTGPGLPPVTPGDGTQ